MELESGSCSLLIWKRNWKSSMKNNGRQFERSWCSCLTMLAFINRTVLKSSLRKENSQLLQSLSIPQCITRQNECLEQLKISSKRTTSPIDFQNMQLSSIFENLMNDFCSREYKTTLRRSLVVSSMLSRFDDQYDLQMTQQLIDWNEKIEAQVNDFVFSI